MRTKVEYDDRTIAFTEGGKIVLHCKGKKMLTDVVITIEHIEPDEPTPQLTAPKISLVGDILTITDESNLATSFDVLADGNVVKTVYVSGGSSAGGGAN